MSEDPTSPRGQLRQEAASWFVIMRGPEAEAHRADFEEWLRRDAVHRRAYNSVSETFTLGKLLKTDVMGTEPPSHAEVRKVAHRHRKTSRTMMAVFVFGLGLSVAGLSWHALKRIGDPTRAPAADAPAGSDVEARYATTIGQVRNFALPDGTKIILDTNSLVLASFTPSASSLRLIRGRARFFSDSAQRTLVVRADTIVIRAKDAIYDVALATDTHVTVNPITGYVEVQYGADPTSRESFSPQRPTFSTMRVGAGNRIELEAGKQVTTAAASIGRDGWPDGVEQFDAVPLARLVSDANRYTVKPIRLSDDGLASLKVSGTFRLVDTRRLALQIAQLLDLRTDDRRNVFLLGPRCPQKSTDPRPSPS